MKDRIKKIRKDASVNQTEFAETLGLSRGHIAQVEIGNSVFSDRTIKDICRIYKVDEHWLRTGEGDPYPPKPRDEQIAEFINDVMGDNNSFKNRLVYGLSKLSAEDWEALANIIEKMSN